MPSRCPPPSFLDGALCSRLQAGVKGFGVQERRRTGVLGIDGEREGVEKGQGGQDDDDNGDGGGESEKRRGGERKRG